jgi:hypothetical protein
MCEVNFVSGVSCTLLAMLFHRTRVQSSAYIIRIRYYLHYQSIMRFELKYAKWACAVISQLPLPALLPGGLPSALKQYRSPAFPSRKIDRAKRKKQTALFRCSHGQGQWGWRGCFAASGKVRKLTTCGLKPPFFSTQIFSDGHFQKENTEKFRRYIPS